MRCVAVRFYLPLEAKQGFWRSSFKRQAASCKPKPKPKPDALCCFSFLLAA
jgi:hypothetical protein